MTNLIIKIAFSAGILSILGLGILIAYEPWFELAEFFESKLEPPEIFFEQQSCVLGEIRMKGYFQVGETRLKSYVNVGVYEKKLYLSHTPPLEYFFKPLLIDLDAISKIESCYDPLLNRCYKFYIGEPHITTLILSQELIEKLEKDYEEPIFSNKLGELD